MDHLRRSYKVTKNDIHKGLFSFRIDESFNRLQNVCCVSSESDLNKILQEWKIKKHGLVCSLDASAKSPSKDVKDFLVKTVRLTGAAITAEEPSENVLLRNIVKVIERESDFIPPTIGMLYRTKENDFFEQLHCGEMSEEWANLSLCTHLVFIQHPYDIERAFPFLNVRLSGELDPTPVVYFTNIFYYELDKEQIYPENQIVSYLTVFDDDKSPEDFTVSMIRGLFTSIPEKNATNIKTILKFALVLKANINIAEIMNRFRNVITDEDKADLLAYSFNNDRWHPWHPSMIELRDDIQNPKLYQTLLLALHGKEYGASKDSVRDFEQHYCTIRGVNIDFSVPRKQSSIILCLFLWAIENQKFSVAFGLWRQTGNMMSAALLANQCLLTKIEDNTTAINDLENIERMAKSYNEKACNILTECSREKMKKTKKNLVRKRNELAGKSLLQIAKYNRQFIAHDACFSKVNEIWFTPLETQSRSQPKWLIQVCVLLPILAPLLLQFRSKIVNSNGLDYCKETEDDCNVKTKKQRPNLKDYGNMVLHFLNAPLVKFTYHVLSFLTFLVFFAYDLTFDVAELTWNDGIVVAFVVSFVSEEIRQMYREGRHYVRNIWNWIDISSIALFISGQSLTYAACCSEGGRLLLAISFIGFSIRLLQVFTSLSQIGPLLIMIAKMLVDTVYFLGVLSVVVISYAISSRAVLYPNSKFTWSSLYMTFWKPYWHIFGELFLDEIKGDAKCEAVGTVTNSTASCPSTMAQLVMPVLLGIYMIIVQVLLINLLIAKFSFTVTTVHEEIDIHWRYLRFHLVNEYSNRTLIFPPFSFIYHVYLLICFCANNICLTSKVGDMNTFYGEYDSFCVTFHERENTNLNNWENKRAKTLYDVSCDRKEVKLKSVFEQEPDRIVPSSGARSRTPDYEYVRTEEDRDYLIN